MTRTQKVWAWVVKYWQVFAGILGTLAGVVIVVLFKRNKASNQRHETSAEIAANERDIARAEGRQEATRERIRAVDEQIDLVNGQLEDQTRKLRNARKEVENMTSEEKIERFRELGY